MTNYPANLSLSAAHIHNLTSNFESKNLWEICEVLVALCTIVDIYLFVCLVWFHHKRSRRSRKAKPKNFQLEKSNGSEAPRTAFFIRVRSTNQDESFRSTSRPNAKFKLWMLRMAIAASFFAIMKYSFDQIKFFYAWEARSDFICEIANDLTEIALYGVTINCVYAFLWMRQWLFYNNPAVRGLLYRKCLIVFSKCLLIVIIILSLILAVFHLLPQRYKVDRYSKYYVGCISVYDMNDIDDAWPIIMYIILTSTFQLSLLGLFVYPFLRRKIDMLPRHRHCLENERSCPAQSSRSPSLNRILKRKGKAICIDSPPSRLKGDRLSIDTASSHNSLQMPVCFVRYCFCHNKISGDITIIALLL